MVLTLGARATYAAPSVRHQCVAGETQTASAAGLSISNNNLTNNNNNNNNNNTATITQQQQQQAPVMSSKVSRLFINLNCLTPRNEESVRQDNANNHPSSPADLQNKKSGSASNDSDKPQLTDILSWNESFDNLLNSKKGRSIFQNFLKLEFSDENLLFWIACEELKSEKSKDAIEERARMIYEDFISVLSPKEVSLDARVREQVNRAMVEPRANIFDEAQLQVYMLMKRDSYPRFISSPVYKKLMQEAGKGSSSLMAATGRAGAAAGSPDSLTTS